MREVPPRASGLRAQVWGAVMDFIAAVVAIVALVLVIKLRRRTAVLEQHVALINQRLPISRVAPPEAAPEATPESPPLPVEMPAPPTPTEQIREAAFDQPFQESSAPPSPPPPPLPAPEPAQSFEERFGARWVVWIGGAALPRARGAPGHSLCHGGA